MSDKEKIIINVNGDNIAVEPGTTLSDLVHLLKLDTSQMAVELNQIIIPRSLYGEHVLKAGDSVEIVEFVGGG
ncbi:sulfur carrier protein ThiS [Neorickettsia sennetsu]|uniref:Thiamine biosynthesis protein ThiS n=1 Tax=Ehrlichia sennetsu (strain ATCC VR-367 / Miyayama) TaxID=222891 RepID=Q2GF10_EHRS3|nr:sulfur carrier protein ThiS [Neorickettsia sennetsu]ABD46417.1 thiamine biosynthesis protein ThiS [Neorickettsia sennetsu str. Miyayama]